jgi:hypothetical protein
MKAPDHHLTNVDRRDQCESDIPPPTRTAGEVSSSVIIAVSQMAIDARAPSSHTLAVSRQ